MKVSEYWDIQETHNNNNNNSFRAKAAVLLLALLGQVHMQCFERKLFAGSSPISGTVFECSVDVNSIKNRLFNLFSELFV